MKKLKRRNQKGFTLVEVIVVLVILVILMSIAIPSVTKYIGKSKKQAVLMNCRSAVLAASSLYAEAYGMEAEPSVDMEEIKLFSNVPGAVTSIIHDAYYDIVHLTYKEGQYTVVYCRTPKDCPDHDERYNFTDDGGDGGGGGESSGSGGNIPDTDIPESSHTPSHQGTGSITVNNGTITITPSQNSYASLYNEAITDDNNGEKKVTVPKGVYEENGRYYIITEDTQIDRYEPKSLSEFYTWYREKCYVVDPSKLFTTDEISGSTNTGWAGQSPGMGAIYEYNGSYYACKEPAGGFAPTNPVNSSNWINIDSFMQ